ncbi:hypothetical protein G6F37_012881 [Rhizopus arrhizus]|nr:hypothetical protein G6F38_012902 [Rhizopus arrhizus]KAG1141036.1 hypothetical protein G6F37_012881 [Rhizopus arrhizus]
MVQVGSPLGIQRSLTSVEHPQTDGLVERINRTIKTSLAICADQDTLEWDQHLPFVTFAYNTATQTSTGFSPFEALYGRKAKIPTIPDIELKQRKPYETEQWAAYLNNRLTLLHGRVLKNIEKSQVRQKRIYNKGKRVKYCYKIGDLVARKNLEKSGLPKERWSGPWIVVAFNNKEGTSFKSFVKVIPTSMSQRRMQNTCVHGLHKKIENNWCPSL